MTPFSRVIRRVIMAKRNNDVSFMENFSCKICYEVLDDPVQCRNNEHYFCRKCITKHLCNSETCPLCNDQLTLETLRPPSRIVSGVVSQMKKPRCRYVARGCKKQVTVDELLLHQETCDFAPVVCSHEGCKQEVNRRDKESHATEECKFRKTTCESCSEEMAYSEYEKHQCTLRKEMNDVKSRLDKMNDSLQQLAVTRTEVRRKLAAHDQSIKDLQDPLRRASSTTIQREAGKVVSNGKIFIFGGIGQEESKTLKSIEVFNWSTKTWTLVENCLFCERFNSYSFVYGKRIMVCGGYRSNRIEFFEPKENGFASCMFPGNLQRESVVNGMVAGNRLLTFTSTGTANSMVEETLLDSPWETRTLIDQKNASSSRSGVVCVGIDIFVVEYGGVVKRYNAARNQLSTLPSLPYCVNDMTTVAYKDNIIILGGVSMHTGVEINNVLMYNVHTLECRRLPSMLKKRARCTAVIIGDVIVVMGGRFFDGKHKQYTHLKSVEYYVIGESTWRELPAMNLARQGATSCVYE